MNYKFGGRGNATIRIVLFWFFIKTSWKYPIPIITNTWVSLVRNTNSLGYINNLEEEVLVIIVPIGTPPQGLDLVIKALNDP